MHSIRVRGIDVYLTWLSGSLVSVRTPSAGVKSAGGNPLAINIRPQILPAKGGSGRAAWMNWRSRIFDR